VLEKLGGRTRARTWDPMIKSRRYDLGFQGVFRRVHVRSTLRALPTGIKLIDEALRCPAKNENRGTTRAVTITIVDRPINLLARATFVAMRIVPNLAPQTILSLDLGLTAP
jgi:hypothetical protein